MATSPEELILSLTPNQTSLTTTQQLDFLSAKLDYILARVTSIATKARQPPQPSVQPPPSSAATAITTPTPTPLLIQTPFTNASSSLLVNPTPVNNVNCTLHSQCEGNSTVNPAFEHMFFAPIETGVDDAKLSHKLVTDPVSDSRFRSAKQIEPPSLSVEPAAAVTKVSTAFNSPIQSPDRSDFVLFGYTEHDISTDRLSSLRFRFAPLLLASDLVRSSCPAATPLATTTTFPSPVKMAMNTASATPPVKMAMNTASATPPPHSISVFDPGGILPVVDHSTLSNPLHTQRFPSRGSFSTPLSSPTMKPSTGTASCWPWVPQRVVIMSSFFPFLYFRKHSHHCDFCFFSIVAMLSEAPPACLTLRFHTTHKSLNVEQLRAQIFSLLLGNRTYNANSSVPQWVPQIESYGAAKILIVLTDVGSLPVLEQLLCRIPCCQFIVCPGSNSPILVQFRKWHCWAMMVLPLLLHGTVTHWHKLLYPKMLPDSSTFPFLYFTVRNFNVAHTGADICSYDGFVGSSLMLGRALTFVLWRFIFGCYGRKPIIVLGIVIVIIFIPLFSHSTSFWIVVISSSLLGSLYCLVHLITYSIGEKVLISQLLSPKFGGIFVYKFLPGKPIPVLHYLDSLWEAYKLEHANVVAIVFGHISKSVSHRLHHTSFRGLHYNGIYTLMFVDDLKQFFGKYSNSDFTGFSVGIPSSQEVLTFYDVVRPLTQFVGAANTTIRSPSVETQDGYKVLIYNWERLQINSPSKQPSSAWAVFMSFLKETTLNAIFACVNPLVSYVGTYLLSCFVAYLGGEETFPHEGYLHVGVLFVVVLVTILTTKEWSLGVDEHTFIPNMDILSHATCTMPCLALLAKMVHEEFILLKGLRTPIHAIVARTKPIDGPSLIVPTPHEIDAAENWEILKTLYNLEDKVGLDGVGNVRNMDGLGPNE